MAKFLLPDETNDFIEIRYTRLGDGSICFLYNHIHVFTINGETGQIQLESLLNDQIEYLTDRGINVKYDYLSTIFDN